MNMEAEEPNKVILYIKKKGYNMDEMVEGTVSIIVTKPTKISQVILKFKGIEICSVGFLDPKIKYKDFKRNPFFFSMTPERETFLKKRFSLFVDQGEEVLQPGSYVYPFKIPLDRREMRQSTVLHEVMEPLSLHNVYYKLKAEIIGGPELRLKDTKRLEIYDNSVIPLKPALGTKQDEIIKWCCFGSGKVNFSAMTSKNVFYIGEKIPLSVLVDNSGCNINWEIIPSVCRCFRVGGTEIKMPICFSDSMEKIRAGKVSKTFNFILNVSERALPSIKSEMRPTETLIEVRLRSGSGDLLLEIPITIRPNIVEVINLRVAYPSAPIAKNPVILNSSHLIRD